MFLGSRARPVSKTNNLTAIPIVTVNVNNSEGIYRVCVLSSVSLSVDADFLKRGR
jgi:hypothetical protein